MALAVFVACAVCFFPLIMTPRVFGYFDAESDAARLEHVEQNLNALRIVFTGIGITEIALGVAVWMWGRKVAESSASFALPPIPSMRVRRRHDRQHLTLRGTLT